MNRYYIGLIIIIISIISIGLAIHGSGPQTPAVPAVPDGRIQLPDPDRIGGMPVEKALFERRSVRSYTGDPLTINELSQLLWAAQGKTSPGGLRTAPSAGALYPLELYVFAGNVLDLPAGVYHYNPDRHELLQVEEGDFQDELYDAALDQSAVRDAAAVIIISAVFERTTQKYGDRGIRYVNMEAGHSAQNIYLQAESLNLGTVCIGAFYDDRVTEVLLMKPGEEPLYIMPVGRI